MRPRDNGVRRWRAQRSLFAAGLILLAIFQSAASAQGSTTVTVGAAAPQAGNCWPFGVGSGWTPYLGFVYKNVPAFQLKTGDTLAFDMGLANDATIQLDVGMVATLTNGGDQPAAPFTNVVANSQTPASPLGNSVTGDYELAFKAEAPFNFAGGGLIIRVSNPGPALVGDANCGAGQGAGGRASDTSGFFVERFSIDADGVYPWSNVSTAPGDTIAQFRVITADLPAPSAGPTGQRAAALKKCKKKHSHKQRKRCKKKAKRLPV